METESQPGSVSIGSQIDERVPMQCSPSFDEEFFADPYPAYRQWRERMPVGPLAGSNLWLAFSHDAVRQALDDSSTFSSARGNVILDSPLRIGKTLGSLDPPRHDALKPIIQRGFTVPRIGAMLEGLIADVEQRAAAMTRGAEFDFVTEFSRPVLYSALGQMLGLSEEGSQKAAALLGNLFAASADPLGIVMPPEKMAEVFALFQEQLAYRRERPGDDLFSVLIAAQADNPELEDENIIANMTTVLLAGNASIGHFLPNLMHALFLHPDQHDKVLEDLALVPRLIEESVRWDTSTQCFARHVTRDCELAGVRVPADARIVLFYASANRDETMIERAEEFDILRTRCVHFGFGAGVHYCMGAMTARRMLVPLLERILPVLGRFELDLANATRLKHAMARGFRSLPIRSA